MRKEAEKKGKGTKFRGLLNVMIIQVKTKHFRQKTKLREDTKNQSYTDDWGSHPI